MKFQEAHSLPIRARHSQRGTIILLVAVVMLFVVGAMAALSIDVVTLYTARSEAQLVADSAALAFARVIANSGATSDTRPASNSMSLAWTTATTIATQVATRNQIAGIALTSSNLTFTPTSPGTGANGNPIIKVQIQVSTLPTFFARIWGTTTFTVAASATAEVYNPSVTTSVTASRPPIALMCVKPWLLPNLDPSSPTNAPIFNVSMGTINSTTLVGWNSVTNGNPNNGFPVYLQTTCTTNCTAQLGTLQAWQFFPGDTTTTFPPSAQSTPSCSQTLTTQYEQSIAGCVSVPISCNMSAANIDVAAYNPRKTETARATNCLTHAENPNLGDNVDTTNFPNPPPFEFAAGTGNPAVALGLGLNAGSDVMVSDSLVTVPVFDNGTGAATSTNNQIIGFVQLFLNADGNPSPEFGGTRGNINTTVVNLAGCGAGGATSATGNPIIGNGATTVAVRLISPAPPSP